MIRAVIFDVGGVLFRVPDDAPRRAWAERLGLSPRELHQQLFENPVARRATVGQASVSEVWAHVAQRLSLSAAEVAQLRADLWQGGVWNQELFAYVRQLRPHCKTGIISDAWPDARENIKAHVNASLFDVILFSAEEGLAKPAPEIFQRALERLQVAAGETVFVDDDQPTVQAAERLGLVAIHFTATAPVLAQLRRFTAPYTSPSGSPPRR